MNYKMNLGAWNSIFAVPCSVVDEHIKLAGAAQLKVLLWFLRHAGENFCDEDMASALSMSPADARDSMQYWIATGIITIDKESGSITPSVNETSVPFGFKLTEKPTFTAKIEPKAETLKAEITPVEQPIEKKQSEPKKPLSRPQKPDSAHLAERMVADPSIAFLMQEADNILGRMTSNADKCTLLMLNEYYGLPVEVIIMLLQYLQDMGKTNMKYIEKVAESWGDNEITTVDRAEKEIMRMTNSRTAFRLIVQTIGLEEHSPTDKELKQAERWVNEWHFTADMIREAYERCVDAKGKYIPNYVESILERWHKAHITTLEQAKAEKKPKRAKFSSESEATYDLEAYENSSIFDE
ncbi:MAG: DnaD domain protein [Ruminococcaceae bacterium]|nr:DnaD domain protein [Oscillospiraceae bacterium]